jgi:hypothetical protein
MLDFLIASKIEIDRFDEIGIYQKKEKHSEVIDRKTFKSISEEQWSRCLQIGFKTNQLQVIHKNILKEFRSNKRTLTQNQLIYLEEIVKIGKKFKIIE